MRYLILSDIHANWEALQAVLADAESRYDRILCCGDVVGYGADPDAVTEWVKKTSLVSCAEITTRRARVWKTWNGSIQWRAYPLCGRSRP